MRVRLTLILLLVSSDRPTPSLTVGLLLLNSGRRGRRKQPLYLADDSLRILLIFECDHEELVALLDADDSVGEEPDGVEHRVAAEEPAYWCADDWAGLKYLRPDCKPRGATERAEQRRADVANHLALELDALAFGLVESAFGDETLALAQILVELLAEPSHRPDGQSG